MADDPLRAKQPRDEGWDRRDGESTGDDGVDVTLVLWFLSLTPLERLRSLQANARALARLRDAAQR